MVRYRQVKLYGNTYVIALKRTDLEDLGWKEGDEVDIDELIKTLKEGVK